MRYRLFSGEGLAGPALMMFAATVIGGGCDYLYQIIMGRQLGPASYSELNAILSVFYIVSVPTQTVATFLVGYVSKFKAQGKEGEIAWLIRKTLICSTAIGLLMALAIYLTIPYIARFLSLTSTLPLLIMMIGIVIVLVSPVGYGSAQGLQRFHISAVCCVTGPLMKLLFGLLLLVAGYGVAGAFGGAVIGAFFTLVVAMVAIRDYLKRPKKPVTKKDVSNIGRYLVTATIAVVCFAILINIDIFFARQYLTPHDAGVYSVASILSKVIWFLPGAVGTVLFPKVSEYHTKKLGTTSIMRKSIILTAAITGFIALVYLLAPGSVLQFLYGSEYLGAATALSILGVAMTLFGLSSLFMNYGLAIESPVYIGIFSFFTLLQVGLIMTFHSSPVEIALDLLATSIGIFAVSWIYLEARARDKPRHPFRRMWLGRLR